MIAAEHLVFIRTVPYAFHAFCYLILTTSPCGGTLAIADFSYMTTEIQQSLNLFFFSPRTHVFMFPVAPAQGLTREENAGSNSLSLNSLLRHHSASHGARLQNQDVCRGRDGAELHGRPMCGPNAAPDNWWEC